MKAAVIHQLGQVPAYETFPDPQPQTPQERRMRVTAASIKNLDKYRAAGHHYDAHKVLPAVAGVDGVGVLEDSTRVYSSGHTGMIAEQAIITEGRYVPLPDHVDDVTAAALPNPGLSAWFSLEYRARVQPGETVFILGATGITGKLAIQLAKYFGAGKVIAAGRNPKALESLYALGADETISLLQDDAALKQNIQTLHASTPFDVVIDYTWGHPTEVMLDALTGTSLLATGNRIRYVTVGEMAGPTITLKSGTLRSTPIELLGVGGGSVPKEEIGRAMTEVLPKLFSLAAEGRIRIDTEAIPLANVSEAWTRGDVDGKRIVIVP